MYTHCETMTYIFKEIAVHVYLHDVNLIQFCITLRIQCQTITIFQFYDAFFVVLVFVFASLFQFLFGFLNLEEHFFVFIYNLFSCLIKPSLVNWSET